MKYDYPFTQEEADAAYDEWGCNCGPTSLAFALQLKLDSVRHAIPGFEDKRYTSPSMMRSALSMLGANWTVWPTCVDGKRTNAAMFADKIALVRIQWTGPWTKPGANPKWAYRQTHWVCAWQVMQERGRDGEMKIFDLVFDCNSGITPFEEWKWEIVPLLTAAHPRADGGWFPTDVWRIR